MSNATKIIEVPLCARSQVATYSTVPVFLWKKWPSEYFSEGLLEAHSPLQVTAASFGAYVYISKENILTPEKAFITLYLFNNMRYSLTFLPLNAAMLLKALVSLSRIENYLKMDDVSPMDDPSSLNAGELSGGFHPLNDLRQQLCLYQAIPIMQNARIYDSTDRFHQSIRQFFTGEDIRFKNANFAWSGTTPTLIDLNFSIKRGELVAVVGGVGTGKSSVLYAILGEMKKLSGSVEVRETVRVAMSSAIALYDAHF